MPISDLTPEILAAAVQGLEAQRVRLDAQIAEVRRLLKARLAKPAAEAGAPTPKPKRELSAAARKRIAAAQKKRWAEFRRKKAEAAKVKGPAAKRKAAPKKAAARVAKKVGKRTPAKEPKTALAESAM